MHRAPVAFGLLKFNITARSLHRTNVHCRLQIAVIPLHVRELSTNPI